MSETLPDCGVIKMKWARKQKVSSTEGIFSFQRKVFDWGARIREVTVSVRSLDEDEARKWKAFFLRVDGQVGTISLTPAGAGFPKGAVYDDFGRWKGTPVVRGAGQTGKVLNVGGLPINEPNALAEGDWFSLGGVLHECIADVASDGSGNGTIGLWRALSVAPDDAAELGLENPTGEFRLLGDIPDLSWTKEQRQDGFDFRAREVLL